MFRYWRGVPNDLKCWFFVVDEGSQLTGRVDFSLLAGDPNWPFRSLDSEIISPPDMFGFFPFLCGFHSRIVTYYLFVSHQLQYFLSKSSWSILTKIWKLARLSVTGLPTDLQDTAWESDHFSSLTGGPNRPLRCLDGSEVRPCEGNLKMLEAGICRDLQRLVCKSRC